MNWAATYTGYLTEGLSDEGRCTAKTSASSAAGSPTRCRLQSDPATARGTLDERRLYQHDAGPDRAPTRARQRQTSTSSGCSAITSCASAWTARRTRPITSSTIRAPTGCCTRSSRVGTPGATVNGVPLPAGTEYVRTRQNEVFGAFETLNSAFYLEDNWSITDNLVLNAGVRLEAFDNKTAEGDSYIKIDDMIAPRLGFSWDMKGDGRMKLFGNAGRYFLPVANVINIKQAGAFLDERTFYVFNGFETYEYNGVTYQRPILGAQFGPVDNSQGDGTVGDFRGEVDADMDPVYQDEFILGFQSMIDDNWSYGVRGIYRDLHNAIDDMRILSTGIVCNGRPNRAGFVMGNPGGSADHLHRHRLQRRGRSAGRQRRLGDRGPGDRRLGLLLRTQRRRNLHGNDQRLSGAEAHVQGARARARSRLGPEMGAQRLLHAGIQRGQRRGSGQFRFQLRRQWPYRGLRRSLGPGWRRRLSAERSPSCVQAARHLRHRRALELRHQPLGHFRPADQRPGRGQPVRRPFVPFLLRLHRELHVAGRAARL